MALRWTNIINNQNNEDLNLHNPLELFVMRETNLNTDAAFEFQL